MVWRGLALAAGLAVAVPAAQAQDQGVLVSPILTLDQERLFEGAGLSARVSQEIERRSRALSDENRRIEQELTAEELDLTERRPNLEPDEFRALADAFDEKVQRLRQEQDAKELALQRLRDEERQSFLRQISPVIASIVRERGALIVIDRRAAILSADAIDITDEAIARVNAALDAQGIGTGGPAERVIDPAPGPSPDTGSDPAPETGDPAPGSP